MNRPVEKNIINTNLEGKVAIITGASRGIGKAIAERLSNEGMRLVLVARSADALKEVATSCISECCSIALDLRNPDSSKQLISFTIDTFGEIDLLVNNAGATKHGDFLELTDADWDDGFALKFFSTVRCSRAAWPHLSRSKGTIVNIVGVGGRTGTAEFAIGGAVNAALLNLTKALADRGLVDGVKVNAINPGAIATGRLRSRIELLSSEKGITIEQATSEIVERINVVRFGEPAEIAAAVAFLASPLSSYCQGTILDVDGGQTKTL